MKFERLIVANWKMNPESPELARAIFLGVRRVAAEIKRTEVVICPPAVYFGGLRKFAGPKVKIGVQNLFWENSGPYTGEFGAAMVVAAGGTHAIVGHSERRELGETSEMVNKKVLNALREDLKVVLCVGEKERDSQGNHLAFIKEQLTSALLGLQKRYAKNLVIAYEPVWAIGKSDQNAMKGAEVYEMFLYIKKIIAEILGRDYAEDVRVLYGGSVSPLNAEDIVQNGHIDGLLVGRQSLDPSKFKEIARIIDAVRN